MSDPVQVRLARLDFEQAVTRDVAGTPWIPAETVAEQGPRVQIVDLRDPEAISPLLGWIPGSVAVPLARVTEVLKLGRGARVVLVSDKGQRAAAAARLLELAGMGYVAALEGGLHGWRAAGMPLQREGRIDESLPTDVDAHLLQPERPPGPLTLDEVRAHVADPGRIRWLKLAAFLLHGKTACVDGRDSQSVVGTPGGDAGEFLLALGAAESLGQPVDEVGVRSLLEAWIESFGRFYLHSDLHALNHYILAMRADPEIPESALPKREDPPTAWRTFNAGPPVGIRERVLHHLSDPAAVGCGHLRLTLLNGEEYGVRPELVRAFLRAYFETRWAGVPELEFVALGGGHQEGAVMLVTLDGELWPHTRVPLVPPAIRGVQTFVHHPQVTRYQRHAIAHWLADRAELPTLRGRGPEIAEALYALGDRQMGATLSRLAKGLPIFEVRFSGDRDVTVRQAGAVA